MFGVGGLIAVFSQKPKSEKLVEKLTAKPPQIEIEQQTKLPPYTMFVEGESVVVKFHSTESNLQFNNISNQQKTCLANGGGVGCVLPGYVAENQTEKPRESPSPNHPRREASYTDFGMDDAWLLIGLGGALGGIVLGRIGKQ